MQYPACDFGGSGQCSTGNVTFLILPKDGAENAGYSCPVVAQPVNVMNGNMWLQQSDYSLPGIGENIEINRFYNSVIQTSGLFGFGWSTKYDESLWFYDDKMIRLNMPDGRAVYFGRSNTTDPFIAVSPEVYGNIVKNTNDNNSYTLTFKDGRVHKFDLTGKLLWQKDRNGNQTILDYETDKIKITDGFNRRLTLKLNAINGRVENACDGDDSNNQDPCAGNGMIATYLYEQGTTKLQTVTYNDGSKYKFEYTNVSGKTYLQTVKDANDNILETHAYASSGRAWTSGIATNGATEKYTFDYSQPNYTTVTDANGKVSKYYFDKTKGRNVVTTAEGVCSCGGSGSEVTQYFYDSKLNLTKKINALGHETTFTYDNNGNRLTQTEKVGTINLGTDSFTYNSFGQVTKWTDKLGGETINTFDANGNLKTATDALRKVTTITYPTTNNKGLPDSVKDARLNETKFVWNAQGLLQEVEDPYHKKTSFTYDVRGRTKTVTNALTHITTYNYFDDAQRKVEMIYPNSDKITYKYDIRRLLESVTDERGKVTSYEYDTAYRLIKITDPLLHIREYDYDLMSNLKLTKDGLSNQTDYKYDDFNRLKEVEYPLADANAAARLKELFEYDQLGRTKKVTDTANRITNYGYDDANRTRTVTNAELETTTTKYNARYQMIQVTDAKNQVYDFTYDPLGRMLTQTRAGGMMSYEYDEVGNHKKRTDYLSRVTNYEYDKLNRLTKTLYGDQLTQNEPPNLQATYGYDDISRLTAATNEAGTVTFAYDNRNRTTSTTDVFGHTIHYDYLYDNAVLNQKQLKFDGAMYAKYNYDDADRLTSINDSTDNTTISFGYDNADKLKTRILSNVVTTTYDYDNMNRLKQLKDVTATATLDRQYHYNNASQIDQIVEPTQTRSFLYDNVDRLTSANYSNPTQPNENYSFDDAGNRTLSHKSASYGYQPFNKLTSTATANYAYDANGNMISKNEGGKRFQYFWDYENRLTMAWDRKNRVRYLYDALGRRVQRFIVGGKENTKFIYDGNDVLVDDNQGTLTKYQNGLGIDNKLKMVTNGTAKYFITDHLGSTVGLADSTGNLTEQTSYDSFGNATNNLSTRYQFTGREFDSFTGLHYYRARWYDGNLGRFISEDPIGFGRGDVNLYGYVGNKPLNFFDPFGLDEYAMMERLASPQPSNRSSSETLDELQLHLGVLGMTPIVGEPFDAHDGVISLARGDYCGAGLSGSSMIPFIGWGAGITKTTKRANKFFDLTDFSVAAKVPSKKQGLSVAGHSLTKHAQGARQGNSLFPPLKGNSQQISNQAQDIADDILTAPGTTVTNTYRGRFGNTIEFSAPDGRGLVYDSNRNFLFFKEN